MLWKHLPQWGKKEAAALKNLQNRGLLESQLDRMLNYSSRYDSPHSNDNTNIVICMACFLDAAQYQVGVRKTDCQQHRQKRMLISTSQVVQMKSFTYSLITCYSKHRLSKKCPLGWSRKENLHLGRCFYPVQLICGVQTKQIAKLGGRHWKQSAMKGNASVLWDISSR